MTTRCTCGFGGFHDDINPRCQLNQSTVFTPEEVVNLNNWQFNPPFPTHPFTCPRDHDEHICLVATVYGWKCPAQHCDYTQNWAHDVMKTTGSN